MILERRRHKIVCVKAIQITEFGGPEVLEHRYPTPSRGYGEVLVHARRSGINFADTHRRRNDHLAPAQVPMIPGGEISGTP